MRPMETGKESEVVNALVRWLTAEGWSVRTEVDWADVVAERGDERLIVEAKGVTTAPGLDVDTLYGQLLRRMARPATRYALVVPETLISAAVRVPESVRHRLGVDVYAVGMDDSVWKC